VVALTIAQPRLRTGKIRGTLATYRKSRSLSSRMRMETRAAVALPVVERNRWCPSRRTFKQMNA
jgi:hypothetical protein